MRSWKLRTKIVSLRTCLVFVTGTVMLFLVSCFVRRHVDEFMVYGWPEPFYVREVGWLDSAPEYVRSWIDWEHLGFSVGVHAFLALCVTSAYLLVFGAIELLAKWRIGGRKEMTEPLAERRSLRTYRWGIASLLLSTASFVFLATYHRWLSDYSRSLMGGQSVWYSGPLVDCPRILSITAAVCAVIAAVIALRKGPRLLGAVCLSMGAGAFLGAFLTVFA